jgi:hypothetical protein
MADPVTVEAMLRRAALSLSVPPPDAMARAVGDRLRAEASAPRPSRWHRPAFIALAAAVVVALIVAVVPSTRSAVADFLGIGGVRIEPSPAPLPAPTTSTFATTPTDPYAGLHLGQAVTFDEARAAVDFPVTLPAAGGFGPPDAVYLATPPPGGMVSFVWAPAAARPAPPTAPIGVLLSEFRARVDFMFAKKLISTGTKVEFLTVGGDEAVWIAGPAHSFGYTGTDGVYGAEDFRLAANTLLWVRHGITYRLESALDRDTATAIALSMR